MNVVKFSKTGDYVKPGRLESLVKLIHKAFDETKESDSDLQQHVSEEVLAELCDLEKSVSINRLRNYPVRKKLGLKYRKPEFFTKSQPSFGRLRWTKRSSDPSWRSGAKTRDPKYLRRQMKRFKRGDTAVGKNIEYSELEKPLSSGAERKPSDGFRRFEARRFLHHLENEVGFKLFWNEKMENNLDDFHFYECLDSTDDLDMANVKKAIQENILNEGHGRYPRRNIASINYFESDESSDDEFACEILSKDICLNSSEISEQSFSVNRSVKFSENMVKSSKKKPRDDYKQRLRHCSLCLQSFTLLGNLRVHMRLHTGEKPYKCLVCGLRFTQHGRRNAHVRIHTGEKPYECSVCGRRFTQLDGRNKHMRIHTGEKPYDCSVCGRRFSQSGSRNTHMRNHTGINCMKDRYVA